MEIVIQIAGKIVEYTFAPVGQWLCHSFHYNNVMENLKNQEKTLRAVQDKVQHTIAAASRNGQEIEVIVRLWLEKVDEATTKLSKIDEEARNRSSNAACLNLKHRHQLSREAKKLVENIAQLLDEYHKNENFVNVGHHPPLEGLEMTGNKDYMAMESRMTAVKEIMEALRNADIDKIGVWGMPGVGKSTLMKEIARQAREEKLFNEVVMAFVTNSPDVRRIQGEIAYTLGLNFDQETEKGRASQLNQRLSKDKKILVILDDIWKELDLQEIGIPSEGCKVVMTSRDRDVLICGMGARKDIKLEILQEAEAFNLIEKIAGDSFKDQPAARRIATEIAKKCEGLPIALVIVSKALKNKSLGEWKDTLRRLKTPAPENITGMLGKIYSPIEVSYNNLESPELKSLFLLCAQLPYFLFYRDLLIYSYGYGLSHGINTLEEARDTQDTLLRKLKDSCLLLERSDGFCMHDLVRDVAIIIASKERNMFVMRDGGGLKEWPDVDALKRCQAFSIFEQLPNEMELECPELIFFHISSKSSSQIPNTLFQGMEKLKVLDLTNMRLTSLPSSLLVLRNLQTLCLDDCMLEDISGIGELKNLVVLSLLYSQISKLPREIGSLVRLRMLDLSKCYKLEMIPPNVISSLVKLEELYMGNSIVQWEVEGLNDERKNASLAELKHLSNLNTLEIQIPDVSKLPKDFNFEKLVRYKICIGDVWDWSDNVQSSRTLKLKLNSSIQSEFWNKMPSNRVEILHLEGRLNGVMSVIPETDTEVFQQMKYLRIHNGVQLKYIVNLSTSVVVFPTLETFILSNMIKLEEICQGELPSTSFKNLRVLKLENCEKLRFVFSSSIVRGLSLLEKLKIRRCNSMGAIVVKEEKDGIEDGDVVLFHQLQTLVLEDLPELVSFLSTRSSFMTDCGQIIAEGNHDLHMPLLHYQLSFPSLKTLQLKRLPKIKHVWSKEISRFPDLLDLCVDRCENLKSLFPVAAVATSLSKLKSLEIRNCEVLEEIVQREDGTDPTMRILFTSLTYLSLEGLPKLKWFFQGVRTLESSSSKELHEQGGTLFGVDEVSFPSLQTLHMKGLPKIKHVWNCGQEPKTVFKCVEQLKTLWIKNCEVLEEIVGGGGGAGAVARTLLEFPRVTNLRLENLKRLKWFYKGVHVSKWPMLEEIQIEGCEKVEIFASGVVSFEETVEDRPSEMSIKQPIFLVDELSFSSLKKLLIQNMDKLEIIWQDQVAASSFSKNIQDVEIDGCEKLLHVFQSNFRTTTILSQRLTRLHIRNCRSLESIFRNMEGHNGKEPQVLIAPSSGKEESVAREDGTARHIEFPILTQMRLCGLPKLKWILEGVDTILECPSLEKLELFQCEQVLIWASKFGSSSSSQQNQLQTCIQLPLPNLLELQVWISWREEIFPYELVDPVPRLRQLHLRSLPMLTHLWKEDSTQPCPLFHNLEFLHLSRCRKLKNIVPSSVFLQNLTELHISYCDGLINLLTSTTAKTLVQLKKMTVMECKRITEIVAMEDGEEHVAITFNKLAHLELVDLPNLTHFCSGPYSFGESLKNVIVTRCPEMKPLCRGVSSTPELKGVYHT
ncbi:hypothetical protein F2P56_019398 [Juglans regia]|uniref:AAA+ ATPase domain-containing protein n=2 Tax=Juglans regia TaxID=51240 RepID=A0A834CS21_JUGRE|nr:probable disease resistance protein At4g27220 isoform X1 [Juglans regia]KAF5463488.1 hypothetical protein F2P56_019398 [Juglans regia]